MYLKPAYGLLSIPFLCVSGLCQYLRLLCLSPPISLTTTVPLTLNLRFLSLSRDPFFTRAVSYIPCRMRTVLQPAGFLGPGCRWPTDESLPRVSGTVFPPPNQEMKCQLDLQYKYKEKTPDIICTVIISYTKVIRVPAENETHAV